MTVSLAGATIGRKPSDPDQKRPIRWFGLGRNSSRLWFLFGIRMIHPYAMYDSSDNSYVYLLGDLRYLAYETMYPHAYLYILIHHPSRDYMAPDWNHMNIDYLPDESSPSNSVF
jgi:hypothetical protein